MLRIASVGFVAALAGAQLLQAQSPRVPVSGKDPAAPPLVVRNNHDLAIRGPLVFRTDLPEGQYRGPGAVALVRAGSARVFATLPAKAQVRLERSGSADPRAFAGDFAAVPAGPAIALTWQGRPIGTLELGLAAIPGVTATVDTALRTFAPLPLAWRTGPDGSMVAQAERAGYRVELSLTPYGTGWLDARAKLTRVAPRGDRGYLALVRRLTMPGAAEPRLRFNGRILEDVNAEPDLWDRDFWYTRGVDWTRWNAGGLSVLALNGFTPAPTIAGSKQGDYNLGSHFYVWERTRRAGDRIDLVSEISGPNPGQTARGALAVTPYAPVEQGDTLVLKWRLALENAPGAHWENAQLRAFAGYRATRDSAGATLADVGVPWVKFGTSYFPYSTLAENLDFYRTPGLDRETFWAISPAMWTRWREFIPRMKSDIRIAKAMGFDVIRLHHIELLQKLERKDALEFLDFFAEELRAHDLQLMLDTEGPPEWVGTIVARYRDLLMGVELENEVLIEGVTPGSPERWTSLYRASKGAAPEVPVYLTSAGNHGQLQRAHVLGVPFDRVGLHAYKHGPQWIEAYLSHMLGAADVANDYGMAVTLGEFNWKDFTEFAPAHQRALAAATYDSVLAPRAIPEVIEFQFHETLSFNPAVSGTKSRHYEPLTLDRRLKVSGEEWVRVIRQNTRPDAPVRVLPMTMQEVRIVDGVATAEFTVTNAGPRPRAVALAVEAFDGLATRLLTPAQVMLGPGESHTGRVALRLAADALPGTYHHFVRATYGDTTHLAWGIASRPGAPTFSAGSVLGDRVTYPQGTAIVERLDWSRPLAVTFGDSTTALELESAYQVWSTLQAATGKPVWLSAAADLPDSLRTRGLVISVGTPTSGALLRASHAAAPLTAADPKQGILRLDSADGRQWLHLAGADRNAVHAAAGEFMLRYWPAAKYAAMRITGKEPGNALGHRVMITTPDPP